MYQSIPNLTIPPGKPPRNFFYGRIPIPRQKEFETPTLKPIKNELTPPPQGHFPHNFIIFRLSKVKLGLQLRPRLQNGNGLSQKENVKSITFTFVIQFGATFEIKFLMVY